MFVVEGVNTFALLVVLYVGFLSYSLGVWPWEVSVYRKEKAVK